jgi:CsoR family transcriptional regulator, copper-sensing transcriptional repressor
MARQHAAASGGDKEAILQRLRFIEGHVRGVQRMVQDDRDWQDVVTQVRALQAAARAVALLVLRDHLRRCLTRAARDETAADAVVEEALRIFDRALLH